MKSHSTFRKTILLLGGNALLTGLIVLAILFLFVPRISAASGCFPDTDGHWAEEFICWLADQGITSGYPDGTYQPERNVTRAEMAVFLNNTYQQTAPISGEIWINAGHVDWISYNSHDGLTRFYGSQDTIIYNSSANPSYWTYLQLSPDIPSVLFGRRMQLQAVRFCYSAHPNAYLNRLWIKKISGVETAENLLEDATDRTDSTCRTYDLPSPVTLQAEESVSLFLQVNWTTNSDAFKLGNTSFIFEATDIPAAAP